MLGLYASMVFYLIVQVWVLGWGCCGAMQRRSREDDCEASVRILQDAVKGLTRRNTELSMEIQALQTDVRKRKMMKEGRMFKSCSSL